MPARGLCHFEDFHLQDAPVPLAPPREAERFGARDRGRRGGQLPRLQRHQQEECDRRRCSSHGRQLRVVDTCLLSDHIRDHQDRLTNDQVLANYHVATDSALVRMAIEIANEVFGVVSTEYLKVAGAERSIGPDKRDRSIARGTVPLVLEMLIVIHGVISNITPALRMRVIVIAQCCGALNLSGWDFIMRRR